MAIRTASSSEPSMVKLMSAAPNQMPGQRRVPQSKIAASAIPEGAQTAVAYPGGIAKTSDNLAATKYTAATSSSWAA